MEWSPFQADSFSIDQVNLMFFFVTRKLITFFIRMTHITPACALLSYFCKVFGLNLKIAHRNGAVSIYLEIMTFRMVIAMRLFSSSKKCIHTPFVKSWRRVSAHALVCFLLSNYETKEVPLDLLLCHWYPLTSNLAARLSQNVFLIFNSIWPMQLILP